MMISRILSFTLAIIAMSSALISERAAAQDQTITNVAQAEWLAGQVSGKTTSNEISIAVTNQVFEIDSYRIDNGSSLTTNLPNSICGNASTAVGRTTLGSEENLVNLSPTDAIHIGAPLVLGVTAQSMNRDANAVDSLRLVITTENGDEEEIVISETGLNTGQFMGSIATGNNPQPAVAGDCILSLVAGEMVSSSAYENGQANSLVSIEIEALADPFGYIFDSLTGEAVDGVVVTLIDAATGLPADVFALDGVTTWPSTVTTGEPIVDGAGNIYNLEAGEYRFPLVAAGDYYFVIEPPAPYTAPSVIGPDVLADLTRPDGTQLVINDGSYGGNFAVVAPTATQVDIPLDRPAPEATLTKTASRNVAEPGDPLVYTVTIRNEDPSREIRNLVVEDRSSNWLRLRTDTVRIDGEAAPDAVTVSDDGNILTIRLDSIAGGSSKVITYVMIVAADAPAGDALNIVEATDQFGNTDRAQVNLRISRESIAGRMTLIGRITGGVCAAQGPRIGVPGVRVMLEDGSFAVTDSDGRYHFEGLVPGTHVVQVAAHTLPEGGQFIDCARSTRSAGSAHSRFVTGQGGTLAVVDFHAVLPEREEVAEAAQTQEEEQVEFDWFSVGNGPSEFLFPAIGHNPRAPAIRVAIRHQADQTVELLGNGEAVDPITFEGTQYAADRAWAVSLWRAIHIEDESLHLMANITNADGTVAQSLDRHVSFSNIPAEAELVLEQSQLVADGTTRPVLAVRITDRHGRPVHEGMTGEFSIGAPYESAQALDAMQSRALSGLEQARPQWRVEGTDGIAYIELAPTMVSGRLTIGFSFAVEDQRRERQLDAWIVPGDMPWTLVGLAEASAGSQTIADNMETTGRFDSDLGDNVRVALYAKGRILGRYLLTLSYDSAKQEDQQPLLGAIDPQAYYTVFADGSSRRFDAASREKLYVRIESSTFYVLYGDFVTGFDQTEFGRYNRTMTGVQGELDTNGIHARAFAAEVGSTHRRDEIQGEGLSGPYQLSDRNIIANSERVVLEVRDRFRSELIIETRELERFIDYDIDLLTGTISFNRPILSRDGGSNPQFIVIDYEVEAMGDGSLSAGIRADYTTENEELRLGVTLLTDGGEEARTNLAALDVRYRPMENTEIRAEIALSRTGGIDGADGMAWKVEAEHHDGSLDVLAYARSVSDDFGLGQQNTAESGRRKYGIDARLALTENLSLSGSGWIDNAIDASNSRRAARLRGEYRTANTDLLLGISHFNDSLASGEDESSTVLEGGVTHRLLGNQLELSALSSIALGDTGSSDLPTLHRLGARYAITSDVRVVGTYEIASGDAINARTARVGLEVSPWAGARIISTLGQSSVAEAGDRSFAAFGLAQTYQVSSALSIDATFDHNRTISSSIDPSDTINPQQPAAFGGRISGDSYDEDFTAATLGATLRQDRWSITGRAEWRDGELADRRGLTFGAIRQLGEGRVVGAGFSWTGATSENGATTEVFDGALVAAIRPADSELAHLAKIQFRSDKVTGAVQGQAGSAGNTVFNIDGDALSRRLIGSYSVNWSPRAEEYNDLLNRSEFSLFLGSRYSFDMIQGYDISAWTMLMGFDARFGIGDHIEAGVISTVRANVDDGYIQYAIGPNVGISPTDDLLVTVGYNFIGFRDPDFSTLRNTREGFFITGRFKFDADSFGVLGLGD